MDARHKTKALIGLGIGLPLFLGGMAILFAEIKGSTSALQMGSTPMMIAIAMIAVSVPFYLWGCAQLAKAKGYSTAILLTCFLGWLFPVVVLLALPDKNKQQRRWW